MNTHTMTTLLAATLLALTGCRHDGPTGSAFAPVAASAGDFPVLADDFDADPLAGRFSARDVALELHGDGRYLLRAERKGSAHASEGLWSLEPGTGQLLLVPHAADEPRRRYSMPSDNELMPEDGGFALLRDPATAAP